jgi:hypothetical protein
MQHATTLHRANTAPSAGSGGGGGGSGTGGSGGGGGEDLANMNDVLGSAGVDLRVSIPTLSLSKY